MHIREYCAGLCGGTAQGQQRRGANSDTGEK